MVISLENVSKEIKGKKVLDNISAEFESGFVYGLVGRNGSGKTMLLRAISGLIKIDDGNILFDGETITNRKNKTMDLGIMIENMGLYPELNAYENLNYLTGLNKKVSKETINKYIDMVGLDSKDKRPFHKYSLGMKQRLVFAQAIYENPSILLLDEPTNSLDENGVETIRNIIKDLKSKDRIIIITSHIKEDIDILTDKIYTISDGRLEK
ncbi:MAG: ABC transporter ATP-binding protein [Ruminococcus flavefaciens]|nr:ABC transporter ATP-binding protein [Ruminococcus flavefaciens]